MIKTKSQMRQETEAQVKAFIRSGGSVEVIKARKAPKQRMSGKTTRGFIRSTSGFATGFTKTCL